MSRMRLPDSQTVKGPSADCAIREVGWDELQARHLVRSVLLRCAALCVVCWGWAAHVDPASGKTFYAAPVCTRPPSTACLG